MGGNGGNRSTLLYDLLEWDGKKGGEMEWHFLKRNENGYKMDS